MPSRAESGARGRTAACCTASRFVVLFLLVIGVMVGGGCPLHAAPATAWPASDDVSTIAPREIDLASGDPFTPADIGHARARHVHALLYLPRDASAHHKVPAVVLLHGSIGNYRERAYRYALPLSALGVAVLVVETYDSREDLAHSFIGRALHITETMFDADAYAGLAALAKRPDIDGRRVALVGFSYGGMAATYALYDTIAKRLDPAGPYFAAHVAYYSPCIARFDDSRTTGAPLLMLYGGRDQLIHADRCRQIARDLEAGGSQVRTIVYPQAVHQWDGELPPHLVGRHLAACRFRVGRSGHVRDARTGLPMSGPLLRGIALGLCTSGRHWPIGRNDQVADQSNRDLLAFLAGVFDMPGLAGS